jgi:hypothetical protein
MPYIKHVKIMWNYESKEDYKWKLLAYYIINERHLIKLSLIYKIKRFFKHLKWSDKYFHSGGGRINDTEFFLNEITFHLKRLSSLTHLSPSELRGILISGIRVYFKNGLESDTPIMQGDLHKCLNLQEFYSNESEINFEFAKKLTQLRVVNLYTNDANNKNGEYSKYHQRKVHNTDNLKSCVVLHLVDSYIGEFQKIPDNIKSLSLRNSNFNDIQKINHLINIEYLDISYTNLINTTDLLKLINLRILNICCINIENEESTINLFDDIGNLKKLELLIIDTENINRIFYNKKVSKIIENKILEVPNTYYTGHISSHEIIKILNIEEQIENENKPTPIDLKNICKILHKKLN